MENRKIRYQLDRLPMVLFIACLAATVVAASHSKPKPIDNLYSAVYVGDENVTEGEKFWISCTADEPIKWYKDDEPIENTFVRNDNEEFTYSTIEHPHREHNKIESTLKVSKAELRHMGKYNCNINHKNSHFLRVHPAPPAIERFSPDERDLFESEDDHEYDRFEPPLEEDRAVASTMLLVTDAATQSTLEVQQFDPEYNDEKSHEDLIEAPIDKQATSNEFNPSNGYLPPDESNFDFSLQDPITTTQLPTTPMPSPEMPSFTNIPLHPTHVTTHTNHAVHSTHAVPSEVQTQNHREIHRDKAKLKPSYDDNGNYKLFNINQPLSLTCMPDSSEDYNKVEWFKFVGDEGKMEEKNVKNVFEEKHYSIIPKEGRFLIERTRAADSGNYSCKLGSESHTFNVHAAVAVHINKNYDVIEEESLEINCIVVGTNPLISWEYRPEGKNESQPVLEGNEHYKLTMNDKPEGEINIAAGYQQVADGKLIIDKARLSDRGNFYCIGTSDIMAGEQAKVETFVRVKGKLAALWPFIGICAEVFVLCAIILIYEKRRNKTDLDESDTDQSPDQKNDHHNSDVRHRK